MCNRREKEVLEQYEDEGWSTVRCGAPDFLFVKTNNGQIVDFKFVEVKSPNGRLTYEQEIWWKVLADKLGVKYSVEVVE